MRMLPKISLALLLVTFAVPAATLEARQFRPGGVSEQMGPRAARDEGYRRGVMAGEDHSRRSQPSNFQILFDYRQGDFGYRPEFGDRNRYRVEFRIGFEAGYREGYARFGRGRPGRVDDWADRGRRDFAADNGFEDGYQEGLNDGRRNHRFDPIAESRYRSGDHDYQRWYGPREVYKIHYREGFKAGYERGYRDGRYDRR
jgi:hypothetical protein